MGPPSSSHRTPSPAAQGGRGPGRKESGVRAALQNPSPPRYNHPGPRTGDPSSQHTARPMQPTPLKTFVHPHKVYRLEYPSHWEEVVKNEGESCGFGPRDRDDVGLWISIMPVSVDTDKLTSELPNLMKAALDKSGAVNLRQDPSLRHFGLVA